MAFGAREDHGRRVGHVARAVDRAHDDRGRTVGLQAAVVEAERLGDPARVEVFVHAQRRAAHEGALVELRVRAEGHRDLSGVGVERAVQLLVPHRDPRIELRGGTRAVRQVEVEDDVADRAAVETTPRTRDSFAGPEGRVAVPTHDDEHVLGDARRDRERGVLQRRGRARATHVHGRGEAQGVDAEVGGELLARGVSRGRNDAVDVGRSEARVGDRRVGSLEDQLDRREGRAAHVVRLADSDDGGASTESESVVAHEERTLPGSRPGPAKQGRPPRRCGGRTRSVSPRSAEGRTAQSIGARPGAT